MISGKEMPPNGDIKCIYFSWPDNNWETAPAAAQRTIGIVDDIVQSASHAVLAGVQSDTRLQCYHIEI